MPLFSIDSSPTNVGVAGAASIPGIAGAASIPGIGKLAQPKNPSIFKNVVLSNLKEFRRRIGDVARGHLFQIIIPSIEDQSTSLTMMAKSTILPSYTLEDKGFDFQGSKYKQAGHAVFEDWNVTFLADEYHKLRHKFLSWQSLIYDPIRQIPFAPGSYKKNDVQVLQLSKDGLVVSGYQFFGMYPSRVGEIQLSQDGQLEEFTVTFAFDYFIINGDNEQGVDFTSINNRDGVYAVAAGTKFTKIGVDADVGPGTGVLNLLKNLNPFRGYNSDINTTDPAGFLDYANWMSFRYSPPLRFRIRNYLPDSINNATNFSLPAINPYDAFGI